MTLGTGNARRDRPSIKREQAEERKAAWDSLSTKEKIDILDRKLGKDIGAKKQRTRLVHELLSSKFTINQSKIDTDIQSKVKNEYAKTTVAPSTPTPASDEGAQDLENVITIFKSSEGDGFVAKVKGIKETAHGATKAEARANAKRLINAQKQLV